MELIKYLKQKQSICKNEIKSQYDRINELNNNIEHCKTNISYSNDNIVELNKAILFLQNFKKEEIKDIDSFCYRNDLKIEFISKDLSKATNFRVQYSKDINHCYMFVNFYYTISFNELSYKVICYNSNALDTSRDGFIYYKFENLNKKIEKRFYTQYKKIVTKAILKNFDDIKISSHSEFYEDYLELKKLRIFK